jgi:glyoxylase-like metal-dependent hydrolase (beta-lactamase superfamily II)/rhodanese-related sulfurtransferase
MNTFYQLFEPKSSTYTYLVIDSSSKEAIIIDSAIDTVERDIKLIEQLEINLKYALETHVHADHITGSGVLRNRLGAQYVISEASKVNCADILIKDGEKLSFGDTEILAISTPGHTDACTSYYMNGKVFTGDALLIRGCGRTDFQDGSPDKLFHSVREKLFKLPDETIVFPAHDYKGHTRSSIAEEKKWNPRLRLSNSLDDFRNIMNNLNLPHPKQIDRAVPGNNACGLKDIQDLEPTYSDSGTPSISVSQFHEYPLDDFNIIDVRSSEEYMGELGHIEKSILIELDDDFKDKLSSLDKEKRTVFVCRVGQRSELATKIAMELGFMHPMNLLGGMIEWRSYD